MSNTRTAWLYQTLHLRMEGLVSQRGKGVRHIDHRIVGHAPYGRCRLRGSHEVIGANSRSGNASPVKMNAIVHTARATRASIAHPDQHQVARPGKLGQHLGGGGFGR